MKLQSLHIFLVINVFGETFSCIIERVIKETVVEELNKIVLFKRHLLKQPRDSDKRSGLVESGDLKKLNDDNSQSAMDSVENKTGYNSKKICSCHSNKNVEAKQEDKANSDTHSTKHIPAHENNKQKVFEKLRLERRVFNTTLFNPYTVPSNHVDLTEEQVHIGTMKDICASFKEIPKLNIKGMAGVWKLAYSNANEPLMCFRIRIKEINIYRRRELKKNYSFLNSSINWDDCMLEVTSTTEFPEQRRHFLQTTRSDRNILHNIILRTSGEDTTVTLEEQSPDQWLVSQDLLLMRDCNSGDVIVFSRIPSEPTWTDVEQAMKMFGVRDTNATVPCVNRDGRSVKEDFKYEKHFILS